MPEYLRTTTGPATLVIWEITEREEGLKAIIGGDSFPVLHRFKHPQRRLEWLATRCCLKMLGISEPIMYAPNRRPYLASGSLHISISHSFPLVSTIVSQNFDVGIDIEARGRAFARIAGKYLTVGERAWVSLSNVEVLALIWSAKETLYKLPGMAGINSFVDMTILPIQEVGETGALNALVRLDGIIHSLSLEYRFLDNHVLTWVACPSQLLTRYQERLVIPQTQSR